MSLDDTTGLVKQQKHTRDAFLAGRLTLSQPRHGFRAGLDSVLLGAAVSASSRSLLDLGAGVGTAGLVALTLNIALVATLAESDGEMADLAADNIIRNGLADRASLARIDLAAAGPLRVAAGLLPDHFASVIANPPFFESGRGTAPSTARRAARHMPAEALDRWVRTAAASAAPAGEVIFVYPAAGLAALLPSLTARFGAVTILPLLPRDGEPASRILIRGIKGSRAPLQLLAARALHGPQGRDFQPAFDAIFRGQARLDW